MPIPMFDPRRELERLREPILDAIANTIDSGSYILGPEVEAFESEVAAYLGVPHAIGVASGTDALYLALRAIDIGPGDVVLTSPFTFFATVSAIVMTGATPAFADIEPSTFNLDPEQVRVALAGESRVLRRVGADAERFRAVIAVHLFGQTANVPAISDAASGYGTLVIEDAAQALGAGCGEQKSGTLGALGCFSFFPTKNIGAAGDGGLVTTSDGDLADRLRMLRAHGSTRRYHHEVVGMNSRLDAVQASILRVKLPHLDGWVQDRRRHARRYDDVPYDLTEIDAPTAAPGMLHSFNQYTLRIRHERRDLLRDRLQAGGISTAIYYPTPVHLQPALATLGYAPGDFPEAERACREVLSLPVFPQLRDDEQEHVVKVLQDHVDSNSQTL